MLHLVDMEVCSAPLAQHLPSELKCIPTELGHLRLWSVHNLLEGTPNQEKNKFHSFCKLGEGETTVAAVSEARQGSTTTFPDVV